MSQLGRIRQGVVDRANDSGWYNGYKWSEREEKLKELMRQIALGNVQPATGPCRLCNDPDGPVEYHDEDYSKPYEWGPTVLFALCKECHRNKLHARFSRPFAWKAFVAHVRRGGYSRDLKDDTIKREVATCQEAIERGDNMPLRSLRTYVHVIEQEWFANLRLDRESRTDPKARPRP